MTFVRNRASSAHARLLLIFTLLALLAGCSTGGKTSAPKDESRLTVESVGFLGSDGSRSDTVRARPGDTVKIEMQVSGFTKDEAGKCVGETAMWLKNSDNKVVYQDKPGVPLSEPFLEGGKLSLTPTLTIPKSEPPGVYTMTATVTDKTAKQQTGKPLTITVE